MDRYGHLISALLSDKIASLSLVHIEMMKGKVEFRRSNQTERGQTIKLIDEGREDELKGGRRSNRNGLRSKERMMESRKFDRSSIGLVIKLAKNFYIPTQSRNPNKLNASELMKRL